MSEAKVNCSRCSKSSMFPVPVHSLEWMCTCGTKNWFPHTLIAKDLLIKLTEGPQKICAAIEGEHTGLSVDYYKVPVTNPTTEGVQPYIAECNDIIEALGMNYAQANVFKAIWRIAAAKNLGKHKKGNNSIYDAEKAVFFSDRVLKQEKANGNH